VNKVMILTLFVLGCASPRVSTDCLEQLLQEKDNMKWQHDHKELNKAEFIHVLNDQLSLVSAIEATNKIMKIGGHEYCDADFNEVRWTIQSEINFAEAMKK
jgi:hypothetical protein